MIISLILIYAHKREKTVYLCAAGNSAQKRRFLQAVPLVILSTDESTTDTKARRYAYRRFCIATGRRRGGRASVRLHLEDID